ncbi:hypothetical protein ACIF9R_37310 [Streptomyces sp. NPDC086080]|uniref:hypothetical protein n=1 Tax=Streptomyces sp. NPDC086080 TaxID=3365748 RepID=UPI0037CFBF2F
MALASQAGRTRVVVAPEDEDSGYFRLNIRGMSRYAQLMEQLGMVATAHPLAAWLEKPDSIDWEDVSAVRYLEGQEPVKPEAVAYAKTIDTYLA